MTRFDRYQEDCGPIYPPANFRPTWVDWLRDMLTWQTLGWTLGGAVLVGLLLMVGGG